MRFELGNQASLPTFNTEKITSRYVVLSGGADSGLSYKLSSNQFLVLRMICSSPLPLSQAAIILGKNEQTLKNQLSEIYLTFGMGGKPGRHTMTQLIWTLLEKGVLRYEPSIRPEQMPILTGA